MAVQPTSERTTRSLQPPEAALVCAGRRAALGTGSATIGRDPESALTIDGTEVSRVHARVFPREGVYWVEDAGSKNGTFLNGTRLERPAALSTGDAIAVGGERVWFVEGSGTRRASVRPATTGVQVVPIAGERFTIGRDATNRVVLDDANVSRFHAEVVAGPDGAIRIRDLGSTNGTYVDGEPVTEAPLRPGTELRIGGHRLLLADGALVTREERGALRLHARAVAVRVGTKEILAPTDIAVGPGEFVAIVGESGAGKSTLIRALAGVSRPTSGSVTVNGEAVANRLPDIGYVPQLEIVHDGLTLAEALEYGARLRLAEDVSPDERRQVVARILGELDLTEHRHTRIGDLSGGQRRRVGVAMELLTSPSLLFLDEPTTGLDPGLEARMMRLLRALADGRRAVTIVTHATQTIHTCDRVVVMRRGGHLAFDGPPASALEFFGVDSFADVYARLARDSGPVPNTHAGWPRDTPAAPTRAPTGPDGRPRRSATRQARILTARYACVLRRDRRNLAILVGQVPPIALALAGLFHADVFSLRHGSPGDAAQLLFLLVTTAIWLGSIDAAREIVKERDVVARERAVGVRVSGYVASKLAVLLALGGVQVAILLGIVLSLRPLHEPSSAYAGLALVLFLTVAAALAMGLAVSAAARSQDQATSLVPLVLIPQLFFAGAIIPVAQMSAPVKALATLVFARWSFAASGGLIDLGGRISADAAAERVDRYGTSFFESSLALSGGVLAAAALLLVLGTGWLVSRRIG